MTVAPPGAPRNAPPPASGGRRQVPAWIPIAVVLVVALAVVAVLLISGGGSNRQMGDTGTSYRKQVAQVFGPVLGANLQLSRALQRLRGTNPVGPRADVRAALDATTAARGGLDALQVPASVVETDRAAHQVLDRESAYVTSVSAVLHRPSASSAAELQTLASNLTSALSAAGPAVNGDRQTVFGTGKLVAWAPAAAKALKKSAGERKTDSTNSGSTGGSTSAPSSPSGQSCGGGVYAGPNTSCSFAFRVRDAYNDAPGLAASVRVFSPVTSQTYTMNCAPSGSGTTCSGGNNASVTF